MPISLRLEDAFRDIRIGLRVLKRSPVFTTVAILTLALGIGANAAIFHLIDTLSLRSLPIENPQALVDVRADGTDTFGNSQGRNAHVTYPLWEQIRTHQRAFSGTFAWSAYPMLVGRGAAARQVDGLWVSADFFRVLGVNPARGRLLDSSDDGPDCAASTAVVSYDYWRTAFSGRESAVGEHTHHLRTAHHRRRRDSGGVHRPRGRPAVRHRAAVVHCGAGGQTHRSPRRLVVAGDGTSRS